MIQMLKGSKINHAWLQQMCAQNPPQQCKNPDGSFQDNAFLTGPVRLSFVNLMKPRVQKPTAAIPNPASYYTATCLFPPGADVTVLRNEHYRRCKEEFPRNFTAEGQMYGLYETFSDQGSKPQLDGYTPGGIVIEMRANLDHRPQVIDARGNPIVEESRVYSGVWAICAGRFYPIGKNGGDATMKKGVRFGLTNCMIIADDDKLGGATADPKTQFAGVTIQADTNVAAEFAGGGGQAAVNAYIPSSAPQADPRVAAAAAAGMDLETYIMLNG